jgi:hypothetical protein
VPDALLGRVVGVLAAAEQAMDEALTLVQQLDERAQQSCYDELADAEQKLSDMRERLSPAMGALEARSRHG